MPKLIVHAGVHRTGTTAIQKFLSRNRQALLAQGFAYPGETENHQKSAWQLIKGTLGAGQFASELEGINADTVIISAEDLCRISDPKVLAKLGGSTGSRAILFVRRQDDWVESWYNQHVKWPFHRAKSTMSPLEFLGTIPDYDWIFYDETYSRWRKHFDKVDIVLFDEIASSVEEFCRLCRIDASKLDRGEERTNNSLSPVSIEIIRHLGMADLSPRLRTKIIRSLEGSFRSGGSQGIFPASVKALIMERFSGSNARLAEVLGRNTAELFPPSRDTAVLETSLPDAATLLRDFVVPLLKVIDVRPR